MAGEDDRVVGAVVLADAEHVQPDLVGQRDLLDDSSRSRCAGPTPPGSRATSANVYTPRSTSSSKARRRDVVPAAFSSARPSHPDELAQRRVGQVGPGDGDADPGQVRLVPVGQVHRFVPWAELGLERM